MRVSVNAFFFLIAVMLFAGTVLADGDIKKAPAFTAKQLTVLPEGGWITNGGNIYNQRYSPLKDIHRGNVSQLKGVWKTSLGGSGTNPNNSAESQAIVYAGTLYITTGDSDVFAIDIDSGDILWSYKANADPRAGNTCCGWANRGAAIGDGKIFAAQVDGKIVALDQQTGKMVWSIQAEEWQQGFSITSAPLY